MTPTAQIDTTEPAPRWGRSMLPRELHAVAWWIWAVGLAAAAAMTLNPWLLLLIVACAAVVVEFRRSEAPWALSFSFYLWFGLIVVLLRVVFRVIFGGSLGLDDPVLIPLPEIPLPEVARGIQLLGDVTLGSVLAGLYDGMRLAAIIICIGAANSLANPRQLLASIPPALYEVGTAIVVALSVFPQLADSVKRVTKARRLRGDPGKGVSAVRRIIVPVLEDALERAMTLAASMDSRGYGRAGNTSARERWVTGSLMIVALMALAVGSYGFLDATVPTYLSWPMLLLGLFFATVSMLSAGKRVRRTRYRPRPWKFGEYAVVASGIAVAFSYKGLGEMFPEAMYPDLNVWPALPLVLVLVTLIGMLPAVLAPTPPREYDDVEEAL